MYKVIVFAGTTEGNRICSFLKKNQIPTCACVATGYGTKSLTEDACLKVQGKRMTTEEMEAFFETERPRLVLDATHPYAAEVTANIRNACESTGIAYVRVLRQGSEKQKEAVYVESTEAAAAFLNTTKGNVLLTTGSKELKKFMAVSDYQNRLYARVLSLPSVMADCSACGFEGKHLIGMQGPFSREMNVATLRQYDCRYLVTKDSGQAGGFEEKMEAALECQVIPVIIGRPLKEAGISVAACKKLLAETFNLKMHPTVTLLGIGMGSEETLTVEGKKALDQANLVIGAKRVADAVRQPHHEVIYEYDSKKIVRFIEEHPEYEQIVIALSGDVGFYSGAKKLLSLLGQDTKVVCGISSVAYFMAKAKLSWDDAMIVSAHGRECNLVSLIRHNQKVFAILGTGDGVQKLARKLVYYDMGEVLLYVGENLSYKNEKIFVKKPES